MQNSPHIDLTIEIKDKQGTSKILKNISNHDMKHERQF